MVPTGFYYNTKAEAFDAAAKYMVNGTRAAVKVSISRKKAGQACYGVYIGK